MQSFAVFRQSLVDWYASACFVEVAGSNFVVVAHTVGGSGGRQRMVMNAYGVHIMPSDNIIGQIVCQCEASAASVCRARGLIAYRTRLNYSADRSN